MIVKIVLGIFAFILAITQVLDFRSLKDDLAERPLPRWRRLTGFGVLRIALAVSTLGLIAASEYVSAQKSREQAVSAEIQRSALDESLKSANEKLKSSNEYISELTKEIINLNNISNNLSLVLDNVMIRREKGFVRSKDIADSVSYVYTDRGARVSPEKGDDVEWSFTCFAGALPTVPNDMNQSSCAMLGYGRLLAFSYPIILDSKSGRKTLVGTASNDSEMVYQSPAQLSSCTYIADAMRENDCELQLSFWGEARYEILKKQDAPNSQLNLSPSAAAACRKYAALYGESCDEAINRVSGQN